MATSTIKQLATITQYTTIDLSGTKIDTADSGWYYAQVDITSYVPAGQWVISVVNIDNWDPDVFITIYGRRDKIILRCSVQKTLGNNRRVILYYG